MKDTVNKGFMTYLFLFLGMIVGVVLLAGGIMFFSPGTDILGYEYYAGISSTMIRNYNGLDVLELGDKQSTILNAFGEEMIADDSPTSINFAALNKLVVKTHTLNVDFIHGQENRIDVVRNITGFTKVDSVEDFEISKQYNSSTGVFTITANDSAPMLTLNNSGSIKVYIKEDVPSLQLEVTTTTADTGLATKRFNTQTIRDLAVESLTVTTESGNVELSSDSTLDNSLNVTATKSDVKISGTLGSSSTNKLSQMYFDVESGDILAENMFANTITFKGQSTFIDVDNIDANVVLEVARGAFVAKEITGSLVDSNEVIKNVKINVDKVAGELTIPASESGRIEIGEANGQVAIKSQTGDVVLKKVTNITNVETTTGDVNVFVSQSNIYRVSVLTDSGSILAMFEDVKGEKVLTSTSGMIDVYYETGITFNLSATTTATIELKNENNVLENQTVLGYPTTVDPEIVNNPNTLTITTESNITIDTQLELSYESVVE